MNLSFMRRGKKDERTKKGFKKVLLFFLGGCIFKEAQFEREKEEKREKKENLNKHRPRFQAL